MTGLTLDRHGAVASHVHDASSPQLYASTPAESPPARLVERACTAAREVLDGVMGGVELRGEVVVDCGSLLAAAVHGEPDLPLHRVTAIRIAPSASSIRQPLAGWPTELTARIDGGVVHVPGGADINGEQPIELDRRLLDEALRTADAAGADAFAVAAVGALVTQQAEYAVADHLVRHGGGRPVVLSHEIGGLRFIAREASTILNAALLGPAERLLDAMDELLTSLGRPRQSYLLADGSRVGREEARAFPVAALDTLPAAAAQGAAARGGAAHATVLGWSPSHTRLFTVEQGCLRADPLRDLPALLPGVHLSQRHAAAATLPNDVLADAIASDNIRDGQEVFLFRDDSEPQEADDSPDAFFQVASRLGDRFPGLQVLDMTARELAAHGTAVARPQSVVLRLAVVDGAAELEAARHAVRTIAQTRVLSVDPQVTVRTLSDHAAPLSFLKAGPVLLRVHVAGYGVEEGA